MDNIVTLSDSLKEISQPASIEEAPDIIKRLETVLARHSNGIGLSAIQIGIPKRIFILSIADREKGEKFVHFVNPEVVEKEERFVFKSEGCLSFPNLYLNTYRYRHYVIKRRLFENGEFKEEQDYFFYDDQDKSLASIAVQHEMDHLDGLILPEYGFHGSSGKEPKVGRNDQCPCGSGKKFKKCCINKAEYN